MTDDERLQIENLLTRISAKQHALGQLPDNSAQAQEEAEEDDDEAGASAPQEDLAPQDSGYVSPEHDDLHSDMRTHYKLFFQILEEYLALQRIRATITDPIDRLTIVEEMRTANVSDTYLNLAENLRSYQQQLEKTPTLFSEEQKNAWEEIIKAYKESTSSRLRKTTSTPRQPQQRQLQFHPGTRDNVGKTAAANEKRKLAAAAAQSQILQRAAEAMPAPLTAAPESHPAQQAVPSEAAPPALPMVVAPSSPAGDRERPPSQPFNAERNIQTPIKTYLAETPSIWIKYFTDQPIENALIELSDQLTNTTLKPEDYEAVRETLTTLLHENPRNDDLLRLCQQYLVMFRKALAQQMVNSEEALSIQPEPGAENTRPQTPSSEIPATLVTKIETKGALTPQDVLLFLRSQNTTDVNRSTKTKIIERYLMMTDTSAGQKILSFRVLVTAIKQKLPQLSGENASQDILLVEVLTQETEKIILRYQQGCPIKTVV